MVSRRQAFVVVQKYLIQRYCLQDCPSNYWLSLTLTSASLRDLADGTISISYSLLIEPTTTTIEVY